VASVEGGCSGARNKRCSPTLRAGEPLGHRSFYLGTPPPPEAEAMMSIQTLQPTRAQPSELNAGIVGAGG